MEIFFAFITATIGCIILAIALIGWFKNNISVVSRILLFPCGIMLFVANSFIVNILGIALSAIILGIELTLRQRKLAKL